MPMSISSDPEPGWSPISSQYSSAAPYCPVRPKYSESSSSSPRLSVEKSDSMVSRYRSGSRWMRVRTSVAPAVKRKFTSSSVIRSIRFLS